MCAQHFGLLGFLGRLRNCKVYLEEGPDIPGGILELGPLTGRSGEGGRGQESKVRGMPPMFSVCWVPRAQLQLEFSTVILTFINTVVITYIGFVMTLSAPVLNLRECTQANK